MRTYFNYDVLSSGILVKSGHHQVLVGEQDGLMLVIVANGANDLEQSIAREVDSHLLFGTDQDGHPVLIKSKVGIPTAQPPVADPENPDGPRWWHVERVIGSDMPAEQATKNGLDDFVEIKIHHLGLNVDVFVIHETDGVELFSFGLSVTGSRPEDSHCIDVFFKLDATVSCIG